MHRGIPDGRQTTDGLSVESSGLDYVLSTVCNTTNETEIQQVVANMLN